MSLSTSGSYGTNGDLYVSGLVQASTISGSHIVVNGNDITTALSNVGSFETTLTNITSGSVYVPKATQALNSNFASNLNIFSNLDSDPTNNTNYYFSLVNGNQGQVGIASSYVLNYTKSTNTTNLWSTVEINTNTSQSTHIKGALTCDTSCNILGKLTATGGITLPSGQTLNNVTPVQLSYLTDVTSSIQTQLSNKVSLAGDQTITGTKIFSANATFNGGITVNGVDNETGALNLNGALTVSNNNTTNLTGDCNIGTSYTNHHYVNGFTTFNHAVIFNNKPQYITTGTNYYCKNGYGGIITVDGNVSIAGSSNIYEYYFIKTTVTTTPILTIPDPVYELVGFELKFFRTPATANAVGLQCATNTNGFIISSNVITPTFTLGSTGGSSMWYKVAFVCLPNPDVAGSYVWFQTMYQ